MPVYQYTCAENHTFEQYYAPEDRNTPVGNPCILGCGHAIRRKFSLQFAPVMQEHYNWTVGKGISSEKQFNDELKRMNDRNTERTGIPHNAVPCSMADLKPEDA